VTLCDRDNKVNTNDNSNFSQVFIRIVPIVVSLVSSFLEKV